MARPGLTLGAPRLAWRLVTHDPSRLAVSAGGIAFAALLIFVQLGFRNGLLDSSLALLTSLDADVFVLHRLKEPFLAPQPLPGIRLYQAKAVAGVAEAHALRFTILYWKNLASGVQRPVRVIGVPPGEPLFRSRELNAATTALRLQDSALVDGRSRSSLGRLAPGPAQIERHEIQVLGSFELGTDILADGHVLMSRESLDALDPVGRDSVEVVLLKLAPGASPGRAVRAVAAALPPDVTVLTRAALEARDRDYWRRGTPISILVTIGMTMGFLIGVGICYQILYVDVSDHLAEFATIKAIGYSPGYLVAVVVAEALVLAGVGFLPGLLLGQSLYWLLAWLTGLVVQLTLARVALVFSITVGMCVVAACLAVFRALRADPAELF